MTLILNLWTLVTMAVGYVLYTHTGNTWITPILLAPIFLFVLLASL